MFSTSVSHVIYKEEFESTKANTKTVFRKDIAYANWFILKGMKVSTLQEQEKNNLKGGEGLKRALW